MIMIKHNVACHSALSLYGLQYHGSYFFPFVFVTHHLIIAHGNKHLFVGFMFSKILEPFIV